jgi:hypothetical protein
VKLSGVNDRSMIVEDPIDARPARVASRTPVRVRSFGVITSGSWTQSVRDLMIRSELSRPARIGKDDCLESEPELIV